MAWNVFYLDARVDREVNDLPSDLRARLLRLMDGMQQHGPFRMRMPLVRSLGAGLWKMRIHGRSGEGRALYVHASDSRVVVLHVFTKKTQKTPKQAIELARRRAREVHP